MAVAESGKSEYSHDVYTDTGELCLGSELGRETGMGRVEYVGNISGDGMLAGVLVDHGNLFRTKGEEREKEARDDGDWGS